MLTHSVLPLSSHLSTEFPPKKSHRLIIYSFLTTNFSFIFYFLYLQNFIIGTILFNYINKLLLIFLIGDNYHNFAT